jgi:hypothetical protein
MGWMLVSEICAREARGKAKATARVPAIHPFLVVTICLLRTAYAPLRLNVGLLMPASKARKPE